MYFEIIQANIIVVYGCTTHSIILYSMLLKSYSVQIFNPVEFGEVYRPHMNFFSTILSLYLFVGFRMDMHFMGIVLLRSIQ
jgi:hypothetical protein